MSTRIHISGLSYFCTDEKLRQAFIPVGTVVRAQVIRDDWGHALGLGIINMACSEDVERVFNEHEHLKYRDREWISVNLQSRRGPKRSGW